MKASRIVLGVALFALSVLFSLWYHDSSLRVAAMVFFTLPPLLLLVGVLRGNAKASFWAGVFGLFWFSHGVMEAYAAPHVRTFALENDLSSAHAFTVNYAPKSEDPFHLQGTSGTTGIGKSTSG